MNKSWQGGFSVLVRSQRHFHRTREGKFNRQHRIKDCSDDLAIIFLIIIIIFTIVGSVICMSKPLKIIQSANRWRRTKSNHNTKSLRLIAQCGIRGKIVKDLLHPPEIIDTNLPVNP